MRIAQIARDLRDLLGGIDRVGNRERDWASSRGNSPHRALANRSSITGVGIRAEHGKPPWLSLSAMLLQRTYSIEICALRRSGLCLSRENLNIRASRMFEPLHQSSGQFPVWLD